ncbi:MAG: extracellular solute-binding protein, partial [Actinobacteria bacterium]
MRYRVKAVVALVAVLALVGAACGGGGKNNATPAATGGLSGTTITLSVSLAESEVGPVQEVLNMFKSQTGVNVKLTSITAQDLPQKLQVEVSSGQHTVQLFAQDNLALATLVDKGLVEDLSDVQIPDGVTPALIPQKFDGKQYFLPFRPNVRVTYVNKDRFASAGVQPPTTTDEFKTVAEKLKQAAGGQGKVTLSLSDT